jgi:hypothetical protein
MQTPTAPKLQFGPPRVNPLGPQNMFQFNPGLGRQSAPRATGGRSPQVAVVPPRPILSPDQFAALTFEQQRQHLLTAVISLEQALGKISSGGGWKKHLDTAWLRSVLATEQGASPDAATRERLQKIAEAFDRTQAAPQYRAISGLWGFQSARNGLGQYAAAPVERSQRRLDAHAATLQRSLGKLPTGAGWQKYLQLDEASRLAKTKETLGPPDRAEALEVAERFQQVAQNPSYRSIAQLEGFDTMRQALQQLAGQIPQVADPQSAGGVVQLADPHSAAGVLQFANWPEMELVVQGIHQNLNAMQQACESDKPRHAAEIKQAQHRLATLHGLFDKAFKKQNQDAQDRLAKLHGLFDEAIKKQNQDAQDRLAKLHGLFDEAIKKQDQDPSKTVELRKEASKIYELVRETPVDILPLGVEYGETPVDILPLGVEYGKTPVDILPLGVEDRKPAGATLLQFEARPEDILRDLIRETEAAVERYQNWFREDSPLRQLSQADAERLEKDLAEAKKKLKSMCQSVDEAIAALDAAGAGSGAR